MDPKKKWSGVDSAPKLHDGSIFARAPDAAAGIRHWDGEIWTRVLVPGMPANALWSLWGDDAGAVWAAGGNGQILQLQL